MTPKEARDIIGPQAEDDYVLEPMQHGATYAQSAPGLSAVLETARLSTFARQYKQRDQRADAAQSRYKRTMERINLAVLATAAFSALMMAAQIANEVLPYARWIAGAFGILSALCGSLAAMWLFLVRQGKLFEKWMTARAEAESARLSYFTALADPGDAPPDPALNLLKLEYFCRYQYDVQTNYYQERGRRHEEAAGRNVAIGSVAVLVSAAAAGTSGTIGALGAGVATAFGALGVVGAALSSYATARETVSQDERNAERYGRTQTALENLGGERLDRVRAAVAQGNAQALVEFVAAVNEQISLEHRQWREGSEATKAAVAKLEQALNKPDAGEKK
jgi:hypothetical protein